MRRALWSALAGLPLILAACYPFNLPAGPSPTAAATNVPPSATPTVEPSPTLAPTLTPLPPEILARQLQALLMEELPPTATPGSQGTSRFSGLSGVNVLPLTASPASTEVWWLAYSSGARRLAPPQNHFVAIYRHTPAGWLAVGRIELPYPDVLDESSVSRLDFGDGNLWLQVNGPSGAHSACFDLLAFDGRVLSDRLSHCASGPHAAEVVDLDGDGLPEILLDTSEEYVFCYACGVRLVDFQAYQLQAGEMVARGLQELPAGADPAVKAANRRAIELASGSLWAEAQAVIQTALDREPHDPTLLWNAAWIERMGRARRQEALQSAYPLLGDVFAGEYPAALNLFRTHRPTDVFRTETPLVAGTPAQGWESALVAWIIQFTDAALQADPDLAEAYFLRGWARHLSDPASRPAYEDLLKAAQLAPQDAFLAACARYIR